MSWHESRSGHLQNCLWAGMQRAVRREWMVVLLGLLAGLGSGVGAPAFAPYHVDSATLHLWHLDELEAPFMDSGITPNPCGGC
jgi:hypothetical protein